MLHSDKTKFMIIANKHNLKSITELSLSFVFNGAIIKNCESLKCLGLLIDPSLSWDLHINKLAKSCYLRLVSLYKIINFIPNEYKAMLVEALVLSLINYMSSIWGKATAGNIKIIENVIRSAARFVTGIRKFDSVAPDICNNLKWLFPSEMCMFKVLCIFFKLQNTTTVEFFQDYYALNEEVHQHRTRRAKLFNFNYLPRTNYGFNTFHYVSITLWNSLPVEIKNCKSFRTFKEKLKTHLLISQKVRVL